MRQKRFRFLIFRWLIENHGTEIIARWSQPIAATTDEVKVREQIIRSDGTQVVIEVEARFDVQGRHAHHYLYRGVREVANGVDERAET